MGLEVESIPIEDTYCEAFDGVFTRLLITAKDEKRLHKAAIGSTSLPSTVFGESEGGVENWLEPHETVDGRPGAIIQIWVTAGKNAVAKLEYETAKRVRQGILVVPTTSVFNAHDSKEKIDTMDKIGHCGDGYEVEEQRFGREIINIPLMMGEFIIEKTIGYSSGIMGGNLWFFCTSESSAIEAGDKAVDALLGVDGVITSFDICSAGSKVETKYPEIGPTTNHRFCPTLKERIDDSMVPEGVTSIPEIVINGSSLDAVSEAMRVGIQSVVGVDGVEKISSGNFGGSLGRHKIYLKDII